MQKWALTGFRLGLVGPFGCNNFSRSQGGRGAWQLRFSSRQDDTTAEAGIAGVFAGVDGVSTNMDGVLLASPASLRRVPPPPSPRYLLAFYCQYHDMSTQRSFSSIHVLQLAHGASVLAPIAGYSLHRNKPSRLSRAAASPWRRSPLSGELLPLGRPYG